MSKDLITCPYCDEELIENKKYFSILVYHEDKKSYETQIIQRCSNCLISFFQSKGLTYSFEVKRL